MKNCIKFHLLSEKISEFRHIHEIRVNKVLLLNNFNSFLNFSRYNNTLNANNISVESFICPDPLILLKK